MVFYVQTFKMPSISSAELQPECKQKTKQNKTNNNNNKQTKQKRGGGGLSACNQRNYKFVIVRYIHFNRRDFDRKSVKSLSLTHSSVIIVVPLSSDTALSVNSTGMCVCVCAGARVCVYVCARAHKCVRARLHV